MESSNLTESIPPGALATPHREILAGTPFRQVSRDINPYALRGHEVLRTDP
jgi:hypothetical protein